MVCTLWRKILNNSNKRRKYATGLLDEVLKWIIGKLNMVIFGGIIDGLIEIKFWGVKHMMEL